MTVWHIWGRRKNPRGARPAAITTHVLAFVVFAILPGAAEATIIDDNSTQVRRTSRHSSSLGPAISRVGLNTGTCGQASLQADAGSIFENDAQAGERAEYEVGLSYVASPLADRLFRNGDSRVAFEPRGPNLDARPTNSVLPDLSRIETRMTNIGNCLSYMQYLLKTIGVIFDFYRGSLNTESDRNVVSNPYIFVFMAAGRAAANGSSSAEAVSQALVVSKYVSKFQLRNTLTTILQKNRSALIGYSSGHAGVSPYSSSQASDSNSKQRTKQRTRSFNSILKNFLIDIFSQVYTYVLITVILVSSLYLRSRV